MGLDIEVGMLADMAENDEEGREYIETQFAQINTFLATCDLPAHNEPEKVPDVLSYGMWGYSGIHYLRRIAAHIAETGILPGPGDDDSADDPILEKYYADQGSNPTRFRHLILHSDAEGYYLPIRFDEVLFPPEESDIDGDGMIGSSYQLLAECEELAKLLSIPTDIDPESDEVWDAADAQAENDITWKKYGVESFVCLRLLHAAKYSIETGAAVVFC